MKKIIILSLFIAFVFSSKLSLAASYPATCPAVAQGILNAIVGGCSNIDRATYSNIYDKCCVVVAVPDKTATPAASTKSTPKPAVVPSNDSSQAQISNPASEAKTDISPASSSVIEANVPSAQPGSGLATSTTPKETIVNFAGFVKSVFKGLFRFFGFGK